MIINKDIVKDIDLLYGPEVWEKFSTVSSLEDHNLARK